MEVQEAIDDVLIHYGKKGMKWGVTTRSKASKESEKPRDTKPKAVKVTEVAGKTKKKFKSEGGEWHGGSEEAKRAAELHRKAKKSGHRALTNKELQELVTRMNLESQYSQITAKKKNPGRKFAEELMVSVGKDVAKEVVKAAVMVPLKQKLGTAEKKKEK